MDKKQIALVVHAALLIGALFLLVPLLTQWDSRAGYLFALTFYWLFFCFPVIGWHALPANTGQLFSERLPWRDWWMVPLLLAQVLAVEMLTFVPHTAVLSSPGMWLALLVSCVNGPAEEIAWRGGFMATFRDRPRLGFWLGWLLYVAWHIPLALSVGISFEGGALAFLGATAALGLFWNWAAWRHGSVFYTAIAHTLTNILVFWVLFDRNGFPVF